MWKPSVREAHRIFIDAAMEASGIDSAVVAGCSARLKRRSNLILAAFSSPGRKLRQCAYRYRDAPCVPPTAICRKQRLVTES